jgi:DNA invertase Pin-like site-specific DNA recombinase
VRAAQYLRTSSDHQEHSLLQQSEGIRQYANSNDFDIVRTYSDHNKSGLDLAHRPGLRALLHDVVTAQADFAAVLVFDVSRWGRFQNTDESACYEFLCRRAGVQVHYCADVFPNDGSLNSNILKSLRRAIAGEYIRELSERVSRAQKKIARSGFKLGGPAGYGLRRVLVNEDGRFKRVLADGDRKSLSKDRVTYALGPKDEVAVVREIFHRFVESGWSIRRIADSLAPKQTMRQCGRRWDFQAVYRILRHPKYMGCIVFNRTCSRLRTKPVTNPKTDWIVQPGSFKSLVPPELFQRAQLKFSRRTALKTDEELLAGLRVLLDQKGRLSESLINASPELPWANTYRERFGSLAQAYQSAQNLKAGVMQ